MSKWKERHRFSKQVYEALPFAYLSAGLLVMLLLRNVAAMISGLILVLVACIVWWLRFWHRRDVRLSQTKTALIVKPARLRPVDRLAPTSWRDELESGHPLIDSQHRGLFGIGNELINAVQNDLPKSTLERLLEDLIMHLDEHIVAEEAILVRAGYPVSENHRRQHAALLAKVAALRQRFLEASSHGAIELCAFLAQDLVSKHVQGEVEDLRVAFKAA